MLRFQAYKLVSELKAIFVNPGHYFLAGKTCTSVAIWDLQKAVIYIKVMSSVQVMKDEYKNMPVTMGGLFTTPTGLGRALYSPVNSKLVNLTYGFTVK